ncbi:MAG: glycosyltransferase family 4 protein [Gemmatimonadota bacterium]|nr:glycosyltransferase family 4 protein [Gemmatimonadota bacterium]
MWDSEYPWDVRTEKTCLALSQAGHDVHILARNRKRSPTTERLPEGTVRRMAPWRWAGVLDGPLGFPAFFNPRWRSLIARVVRAVNADVIIVRDLPLAPAAIRVGKRYRVPVILDMAEHYPAMMRAIWETGQHQPLDWLVRNPAIVERVERHSIAHADHVLVVADEMCERLAAMGVERSRMTRVSNTPMLESAHPVPKSSGARRHPIRLVYLGILEVVRGINELIDAVASLRGSETPCTLLLIGTGRDEQLFRDRAASLGLTGDDIEFAGYVPYVRAKARVADADIGMLPLHRNEHMDTTEPNKLFDYMSLGLPVITSDTIPSARIVRAERAGLVFEAANAADLAKVIASLAIPELRIEMGRNGRAAVERFYNWKHDAMALVKTVEQVRSDWTARGSSRGRT